MAIIRLSIVAIILVGAGFLPSPATGQVVNNQIDDVIVIQFGTRNPRTPAGAAALASTILDDLNRRYPPSARPGIVIYNIRVIIKAGPFIRDTVPLAGEIRESEAWKDQLPGLVYSYFGLSGVLEDVTSQNSSSCGDSCQSASMSGIDSDGVEFTVTMTYAFSFSCSSSNCTLTATIVEATVVRSDDGSPYFGPALVQNPSEEFGGGV